MAYRLNNFLSLTVSVSPCLNKFHSFFFRGKTVRWNLYFERGRKWNNCNENSFDFCYISNQKLHDANFFYCLLAWSCFIVFPLNIIFRSNDNLQKYSSIVLCILYYDCLWQFVVVLLAWPLFLILTQELSMLFPCFSFSLWQYFSHILGDLNPYKFWSASNLFRSH